MLTEPMNEWLLDADRQFVGRFSVTSRAGRPSRGGWDRFAARVEWRGAGEVVCNKTNFPGPRLESSSLEGLRVRDSYPRRREGVVNSHCPIEEEEHAARSPVEISYIFYAPHEECR